SRGRADPRGRLLLGPADGRGVAGLRSGRPHLLVLREVLRGWSHGRSRQGVTPQDIPADQAAHAALARPGARRLDTPAPGSPPSVWYHVTEAALARGEPESSP